MLSLIPIGFFGIGTKMSHYTYLSFIELNKKINSEKIYEYPVNDKFNTDSVNENKQSKYIIKIPSHLIEPNYLIGKIELKKMYYPELKFNNSVKLLFDYTPSQSSRSFIPPSKDVYLLANVIYNNSNLITQFDIEAMSDSKSNIVIYKFKDEMNNIDNLLYLSSSCFLIALYSGNIIANN